jgi:hypothetical protein
MSHHAKMHSYFYQATTITEIERIDALGNQLADLAKRAASLKGYP